MSEHAAMARSAPERFDGPAAWAALSPEVQAEIGAIALEQQLVWHLIDREGPGPESALSPLLSRVTSAADGALHEAMRIAVGDALPEGAFLASDGKTPRIPSLLGGVCRVCGCSQNDACAEGCGWADVDLCTACVGAPAGAHKHG